MDENQTSDFSLPEEFESQGVLHRFNEWIKNHSRAITSLIIVAIIVGVGIYAYNKPDVEEESLATVADEQEENEAKTEESNDSIEILENSNTNNSSESSETPSAEVKGDVEVAEPTERSIEMKSDIVTVSAVRGDGVTHLARYALKEYLQSNSNELSGEQKVYIEDYLRKKTDSASLAIGESKTFSISLITEAIDSAKQLNENQIQNLSKYVKLVPELS